MFSLVHRINRKRVYIFTVVLFFLAVRKYMKQSPSREQVSPGDRIALMQLERSKELAGRSLELEYLTKLRSHESRLLEEINFPSLLPYLKKHKILSPEEVEKLNNTEPSQRNKELMSLVMTREVHTVVGFVECLKESSEHKELAKLFEPQPGKSTSRPQ